MDSEDKLYIKDLSTRTKRGYLCVRVMRKWNYDGNIPGAPVTYIGLLLADEQGNAIYAQIPQSDVERLGSALMVDEVYTIRKFSVRISRTSYVPLDAELMIQMTSFTTITPSKVPQHLFPKLIYNITPFKDIQTAGQAATRYIDVLGIVTAEQPLKKTYLRGRDHMSTLKELTIKDLSGYELTVTLWETCAEKFKLQDASTAEPLQSVVVLFCGCLPKKIFKKTQLNAGNACSWLFNPPIKEAEPLYDSLKNEPVLIHRPLPAISNNEIPVKPKTLEHKTIADMNALDPYAFPEEGYKCTVTITEFTPNQEWWYMGCEVCKKRLWNYGGNYYCAPCKCSTATPLYKVQFTGTDDTAEARFFCYDVVARQIVRRNCDSLLRAVNNAPGLPQPMLNAVGRQFIFTVGLTDQSYRSMESRVYLVNSCTSKPESQSAPSPAAPTLQVQASSSLIQQPPSSHALPDRVGGLGKPTGPLPSSQTGIQPPVVQQNVSQPMHSESGGNLTAIDTPTSFTANPLETGFQTPPPMLDAVETPMKQNPLRSAASEPTVQNPTAPRKRLTYHDEPLQENLSESGHVPEMGSTDKKKVKLTGTSQTTDKTAPADDTEHLSHSKTMKGKSVQKR